MHTNNKTDWQSLWATQHQQAFTVDGANNAVSRAIYNIIKAALKTGGSFAVFRKRLSQEPFTWEQHTPPEGWGTKS